MMDTRRHTDESQGWMGGGQGHGRARGRRRGVGRASSWKEIRTGGARGNAGEWGRVRGGCLARKLPGGWRIVQADIAIGTPQNNRPKRPAQELFGAEFGARSWTQRNIKSQSGLHVPP